MFPGVIIPYHNVQPKLKAQAGFGRNSMVLCPRLYIYHDEGIRYYLMEEFTGNFGPCTYVIIVQVTNVQKNVINYRIKYDATKSVRYGLDF